MNLSWNQTVIESGNRNWQRKTLDAIFSYKNLRLKWYIHCLGCIYSAPGHYQKLQMGRKLWSGIITQKPCKSWRHIRTPEWSFHLKEWRMESTHVEERWLALPSLQLPHLFHKRVTLTPTKSVENWATEWSYFK